MIAEEDDEVVREMDVYVSDKLDLYLMQFPLRPHYMQEPKFVGAEFKPTYKIMDLTVEHDARRYDPMKLSR